MALLLAVACEHKDLCYHHPHKTTLTIVIDWRNCPDAKPTGMCVYFYPVDGSREYIYRDLSRTGGKIDIPDGDYNVICYNNDTDAVDFRGTSEFLTHLGFTREKSVIESVLGSEFDVSNRADGAEDERVVGSPSPMWGCSVTDVSIYGGQVGYTCVPEAERGEEVEVVSHDRVITLYPSDIVCHYSYEVRHVINATYITSVCGTLSGMAPHYYFADGALGDEPVTLPFSTKVCPKADIPDEASFEGEFFTFGHHPSNAKAHKMMFYIFRSGANGNNYAQYDVTDQVDMAPNKRRVHIILDTLNLTKAIPPNGGAFDVEVEGFVDEEEYEIPLG